MTDTAIDTSKYTTQELSDAVAVANVETQRLVGARNDETIKTLMWNYGFPTSGIEFAGFGAAIFSVGVAWLILEGYLAFTDKATAVPDTADPEEPESMVDNVQQLFPTD